MSSRWTKPQATSNRWHQPPIDLYHQRPARSISPRARSARALPPVRRRHLGCDTLSNADRDGCVTAALDHADHCIESDHEGES